MNYESTWKALKAQLEIKAGQNDKLVHKGTLLQVIFLMNALEQERPALNLKMTANRDSEER